MPHSEEHLKDVMQASTKHLEDTRITEAVAAGVTQAVTALLRDKELMHEFWQMGYEQMTGHAGDGASKWVGKRILAAAIAALFIWSMTWLVRNGALK